MPQDPVGTVLQCAPEETWDQADLNGSISFFGPCWKPAVVHANGNFTKVCGESGQTAPCTMNVPFAQYGGEVWDYSFVCTSIEGNQGSIEKAGSTYFSRKAATKKRIA